MRAAGRSSYTYDEEERITGVTDSVDGTTTYTYDAQGQLLTETKGGTAVSVTYDNYGNILTKGGVAYTYGDANWKDKLTEYDGAPITYDAGGNPLSYRGWTFAWEKGRQLKTASNGSDSLTFKYNASGIRTSKTVNGVEHKYILDGAKILRETYGTVKLDFLYDNEDGICGLKHNNTPYYFCKNLQGDIIVITNKDGQVVARYTYDAWGVCTDVWDASGVGIASINPFRYRGYYWDSTLNLYYLQSRYFDPQVGRFVNADDVIALQMIELSSINLFAYCGNNPIMNTDSDGYFSFKVVIVAGIAGGLWSLGKYLFWNIRKFSLKAAFMSFVKGFLTGAILGALVQLPQAMAAGLIGAVFEVITYLGECVGKKKAPSAGTLLKKALVGFSLGILTNAVVRFCKATKIDHKKLTAKKISIYALSYAFIMAVTKGYLTNFFSLR